MTIERHRVVLGERHRPLFRTTAVAVWLASQCKIRAGSGKEEDYECERAAGIDIALQIVESKSLGRTNEHN